MPTYIALLKYTQQGIANMKDSPNRLDAGRQAIANAGGELKAFYLTMGQYDAVAIMELPDVATAAQVILSIAGQGSITSETLHAFTEDEYREIIAGLP